MKLSIITPWYQGAGYLPSYEAMILENLKNLNPGQNLEVILVNDSPWEQLETVALTPYVDGTQGQLAVRVIINPQNSGIQASRVNGLRAATGDYVIFLDQDDTLAETAARDFLCTAQDENDTLRSAIVSAISEKDEVIAAKMYVANAALEQKDGSLELWYREDYHKNRIGDLDAYINIGTQIISPGQVMLPKALIPAAYTENILKKNGADDFFLWLLLLSDETEVRYIDEPLYTHHFTGENISADTKKTDASCYEFLTVMEEKRLMDPAKIRKLRRMLEYKDIFRNAGKTGKIVSSLKNIDILIPNLIFKIRTRTPYGYNR